MKRTARLVISIAAIALTLAIMSVGIYAATKLTLTPAGSNIKFTAKDVAATITGTKQMSTDAAATDLEIPNGGVFEASFNQGQEYSDTIALGDIEFTDTTSTYTLTLNVTNDFTETAIGVTYSASTTDTNGYVVIASTSSVDGAADAAYDGSQITLAAGKTVTLKTTIKITDAADKLETILETGFENVPFTFTLDVARV